MSETTPEDEENKQITNYWYDLNGNQIAKSYANVVTNGANVVVPIEPSSAVPEASDDVFAQLYLLLLHLIQLQQKKTAQRKTTPALQSKPLQTIQMEHNHN